MRVVTKSVEMRQQGDVDTVFRTIAATPARGFVVMQDPVTLGAATTIARLAAKHRLPGSHVYKDFVDAGGLMSYGVNVLGTFEASAGYAHRVLSGAKPADLPMEQPSRMEFAINIKTAKTLGLSIPPSLLLRADQVIE
jgi:putative tryptophan/tyrosine transport system substrate-binding protein